MEVVTKKTRTSIGFRRQPAFTYLPECAVHSHVLNLLAIWLLFELIGP